VSPARGQRDGEGVRGSWVVDFGEGIDIGKFGEEVDIGIWQGWVDIGISEQGV
jgi:hypothetical protein